MVRNKTRELVLIAVLTAVTVVLGRVFLIPTPTGLLTLLDAGVYFTAFYFGKRTSALVGGLSGLLIDLLAGAPQWMLFSLLAHGLQGYFAAWIGKSRWLGLSFASFAMIGLYFIASLILGYGLPSSITAIPGNIAQNFLGLAVGYLLSVAFKKSRRLA